MIWFYEFAEEQKQFLSNAKTLYFYLLHVLQSPDDHLQKVEHQMIIFRCE